MKTQDAKSKLYWSAYFAGFYDQVVDSTALWKDTMTAEEAHAVIEPAKKLGAEHRQAVYDGVKTI